MRATRSGRVCRNGDRKTGIARTKTPDNARHRDQQSRLRGERHRPLSGIEALDPGAPPARERPKRQPEPTTKSKLEPSKHGNARHDEAGDNSQHVDKGSRRTPPHRSQLQSGRQQVNAIVHRRAKRTEEPPRGDRARRPPP